MNSCWFACHSDGSDIKCCFGRSICSCHLGSLAHIQRSSSEPKINSAIFFTCWHPELLWKSFRKTVKKGVEPSDETPSKSSSTNWTAATESLIDIDMAFYTFAVVENSDTRRCKDLGKDKCSTFNRRRSRKCLLWLILYVFRRCSLLTISSMSLLGLRFCSSSKDSVLSARCSNEACWVSDHHWQNGRQIKRCSLSTKRRSEFFVVHRAAPQRLCTKL